jgi:hypothetical protein
MESVESSVNQVITDQTSTNQAVASLSIAVSNLTTKQETAMMYNRIEHMFSEIMGQKHSLPYSTTQLIYPPEYQITVNDSTLDQEDTRTCLVMSDDRSEHQLKNSYLSYSSRTITTLGSGNQTNSHLVASNHQQLSTQK